MKKILRFIPTGVPCLVILALIFGGLGHKMGIANMMNTIMKTSFDLLLNTCFFLMAVCVVTGALGKILSTFGVVSLCEKILRPLMRPLFNLPGTASLGACLTFLSDNPAIITLAHDRKFARFFKKYQLISLTNFGTAFGMGLLVIVFMVAQKGVAPSAPFVGLFGAFCGCIVSTRIMQFLICKTYPSYKTEMALEDWDSGQTIEVDEEEDNRSLFMKILDSVLDGGKAGVEIGLAIIPGVLVISTMVMILTFGPDKATGEFTGGAYQGIEFLPYLASKASVLFEALFGFTDPHLIAFPITALGAVGAAIGLVPGFIDSGWMDNNAIAVCTAIGMCWSGYLSTHTAMLDSLGYRDLTSKAIGAHTIGGLVAGIVAHWTWVLISLV